LPIGRGSRGFEVLVVDEHKQPLPAGERGEIAIRSPFLALAYVEQGGLAGFGAREGRDENGVRLYYTGDLGHIDANGDAVVVGRADDQVKIRGFRVDLSEVAAALGAHPDVAGAVALAAGSDGAKRIEAFVAPKVGATVSAEDLKTYTAETLPAYMAPARIHLLPDGLPLLPNGKTDRKALMERIATSSAPSASTIAARTQTDSPRAAQIVSLWKPLFPEAPLDAHSSFKSIGGDSLSYVEAYLALEKVVGPPPADWPTMSIAEIAAHGRSRPTRFAQVDALIAFRALALVLLIAQHVEITAIGDGLTEALLMISGFMLGQTHWDNMFSKEKLSKILTPIKGIMPPLLAFTGLLAFYTILMGDQLTVVGLFAQDFHVNNPGKLEYVLYWYVHCLVQLILLTFAVQYVGVRWLGAAQNPLLWAIGVAAVGAVIRFLPPLMAFDWGSLAAGVSRRDAFEQFPIFYTSPHAHLASFWLGIVAAATIKSDRKGWVFAALLLYAAISASIYWPGVGVGLLCCAIVMFYVPRLPAPKGVDRVIYAVSAAAIFIYLGQMWFTYPVTLLDKLVPLPDALVKTAKLVAVLVAGIVMYRLFRANGPSFPIALRAVFDRGLLSR
jgi:hypothetical protein